jgi:hypothetical protein
VMRQDRKIRKQQHAFIWPSRLIRLGRGIILILRMTWSGARSVALSVTENQQAGL